MAAHSTQHHQSNSLGRPAPANFPSAKYHITTNNNALVLKGYQQTNSSAPMHHQTVAPTSAMLPPPHANLHNLQKARAYSLGKSNIQSHGATNLNNSNAINTQQQQQLSNRQFSQSAVANNSINFNANMQINAQNCLQGVSQTKIQQQQVVQSQNFNVNLNCGSSQQQHSSQHARHGAVINQVAALAAQQVAVNPTSSSLNPQIMSNGASTTVGMIGEGLTAGTHSIQMQQYALQNQQQSNSRPPINNTINTRNNQMGLQTSTDSSGMPQQQQVLVQTQNQNINQQEIQRAFSHNQKIITQHYQNAVQPSIGSASASGNSPLKRQKIHPQSMDRRNKTHTIPVGSPNGYGQGQSQGKPLPPHYQQVLMTKAKSQEQQNQGLSPLPRIKNQISGDTPSNFGHGITTLPEIKQSSAIQRSQTSGSGAGAHQQHQLTDNNLSQMTRQQAASNSRQSVHQKSSTKDATSSLAEVNEEMDCQRGSPRSTGIQKNLTKKQSSDNTTNNNYEESKKAYTDIEAKNNNNKNGKQTSLSTTSAASKQKQPDIYFEDAGNKDMKSNLVQQSVEGSNTMPEGECDDDLSNGDYDDYAEEVESQQNDENAADSDCSPEIKQKKPLKTYQNKTPNQVKEFGEKTQKQFHEKELGEDNYDIEDVVDKMLAKRDRRIPGSVYKAHAPNVQLIQSMALGQPHSSARVFFMYPKYCFKDDTPQSRGQLQIKGVATADSQSAAQTFLVIKEWNKEPELKSCFQKIKAAPQDYFRAHNMTLGFKITETTHIYNSVVNVFKSSGVRIVAPNSSRWNVMWTGIVKNEHLRDATKYQKINHFPLSYQIGRKDLMWKNVQRMKHKNSSFDFCPRTYVFPEDYRQFTTEREVDGYKNMYIMKPAALSCGKGIKVIGQKTEVKKKPGFVVSQYVSNPHLINGFKYDLRIYCLVTCYDPLKVYIFREGLARFATQKYSNNPKSVDKQYIHLTNYSVNKHNEDYVKNEGGAQNQNEDASKWNLAQLKAHLESKNIHFDTVMFRIKDVMIKTLISQEPHIINTMGRFTKHKNVCFELYGFDILLDSKLKPWLLEVNISPSLSSSSPLDKRIKSVLIADTLNLVGTFPYDRKQYEKDTESTYKTRLMGSGGAKVEKEPMLAQILSENNTYLCRLVKQMNAMCKENGQREDPLTDDDIQVILDFEEEQFRLGNFEKIYPCINNSTQYGQMFEYQRANNLLLQRYLSVINPKHNQHHTCFMPTAQLLATGGVMREIKSSDGQKVRGDGAAKNNKHK